MVGIGEEEKLTKLIHTFMGGAASFAKLVQRVVLVLMLTIVPIIFIKQFWALFVFLFPLALAVLLLISGIVLIFFYFKLLDLRRIYFKLRRYFTEKESIEEYMFDRYKSDKDRESKHFLFMGILAMIIGGYLLFRFIFRNFA